MIQTIGFICTGNTCRSPMAACYFSAIAKDLPLHVYSAGIAGFPGLPASQEAVTLMKELGLNLSGHKSRGVDPHILDQSQLLITMAEHHRDAIVSAFVHLKDRTFLLSEFSPIPEFQYKNIFDPVGGSLETYRECFQMMKPCLDRLKETLCQNKP